MHKHKFPFLATKVNKKTSTSGKSTGMDDLWDFAGREEKRWGEGEKGIHWISEVVWIKNKHRKNTNIQKRLNAFLDTVCLLSSKRMWLHSYV